MAFGKRQPRGYGGVDRRKSPPRERVDIPAQIVRLGARPLNCRIVDLSATGVRLSLESVLGIPDEFELRAEGETYQVKVRRRGPRFVGVKFL